jgi:hypothetical protein
MIISLAAGDRIQCDSLEKPAYSSTALETTSAAIIRNYITGSWALLVTNPGGRLAKEPGRGASP